MCTSLSCRLLILRIWPLCMLGGVRSSDSMRRLMAAYCNFIRIELMLGDAKDRRMGCPESEVVVVVVVAPMGLERLG